jgi:UDP-N-acetylmuramate dehydrogenase
MCRYLIRGFSVPTTASAYQLKSKNTFAVNAITPQLLTPKTNADLLALPDLSHQPFYILGGGSNTLFTETTAPLIIQPSFSGITLEETSDFFHLTIGAAESWPELVEYCIHRQMYGLENLALIPGCAGAAPVQNIGAYGVELSDYCSEVHWFDFHSQTTKILFNDDCQFGYRDSIFKNALHNEGLITHIKLSLPKKWQANKSYQGLDALADDASASQIMDKVIQLRQMKLPDPNKLPNAGSFFKNPLVTEQQLAELTNLYRKVPSYAQGNGLYKLAAAWLIDQVGLKGYLTNSVGVHKDQALVLVNYGNEHGQALVELALFVQTRVAEKFAIKLQPEVRMVTEKGEIDFDQLIAEQY